VSALPARTALIVGASSPLGVALGAALAEDGWAVSPCGRDPARLPVGALLCDLARPEQVRDLADRLRTRPPDLLLWAASCFEPAPYRRAAAEEALAVGALAAFEVGLAHLEGAAAAGRAVTQVHLADLAGAEPLLTAPAYSLAAGAARVGVRWLQRRAPAGCSVVVVRPGLVDVPGRERPVEVAVAARDTVLSRRARLDEVVTAVREVLGRPAAFHGAVLDVDGGLALRPPSRRPLPDPGE
jgi:NAD(P)-dependent dehydrogenase (short-subunit alcohol dehydrogenase family)